MTVVFSGLIIFILVMMFLVYSKCLETYYIMHKERDLLEVHKTVGTALAQGNKEDERAWKVMERTNISMLVLQDNQVIFSPRGDQEQLVSQLRGYVFNQNQDEGELLKSTDNYEIRKIRDPVAGIDYLEMWGTYSKGAIFILRSPLDSIWESTAACKQAAGLCRNCGTGAGRNSGIFVCEKDYRADHTACFPFQTDVRAGF